MVVDTGRVIAFYQSHGDQHCDERTCCHHYCLYFPTIRSLCCVALCSYLLVRTHAYRDKFWGVIW